MHSLRSKDLYKREPFPPSPARDIVLVLPATHDQRLAHPPDQHELLAHGTGSRGRRLSWMHADLY